MKLCDLIDFNPKRPLEKGALAPFIEMADLPQGERDVSEIENRVFNGGGSKFKNGDTLFARITPCLENGKTAKVSGLPDNAIGHGSTEFIVMAAKDPDVDEDFVYYVARHPEFRAYAKGRMEGTSGRQRVSWQAISDYEIPDFSSLERSGIGSVLSSMDNFISNNRRVNQVLEAMARTLFKAWFVDFEPVRAKMEGRWQRGQSLPGLPGHLYDVFPDRLVESELGEIPEGWRMGSLGEVAVHPRRGVQPGEIKDGTPYIALEHMPKRCIALAEWGVANGLESNKYEFKYGEILFGKLRPYFHKVGVAPVDGVCSTDIVVIAPKLPKWFGFVLAHASSDAFVEYTNAGSTGTKMPRTSWSEMARYAVVLPHDDVADEFNQHIRLASEEIIAKIHESKSLAKLRDTLLPRLISGELRVAGAEAYMARVEHGATTNHTRSAS